MYVLTIYCPRLFFGHPCFCRKSHEKAFNEIKNYYNDITLNNLAMIATLKEEIKEKEQKIER